MPADDNEATFFNVYKGLRRRRPSFRGGRPRPRRLRVVVRREYGVLGPIHGMEWQIHGMEMPIHGTDFAIDGHCPVRQRPVFRAERLCLLHSDAAVVRLLASFGAERGLRPVAFSGQRRSKSGERPVCPARNVIRSVRNAVKGLRKQNARLRVSLRCVQDGALSALFRPLGDVIIFLNFASMLGGGVARAGRNKVCVRARGAVFFLPLSF